MEIPYNALSAHALASVIEEFITREGTEYGEIELSLAQKVDQVKRQLERGEIYLSFDPLTETCHLAPRQTAAIDNDVIAASTSDDDFEK